MADKKVKVTLAHPLRKEFAPHYGLDEKDYQVGDTVTVGTGGARDLAGAGYAENVEPEQPGQVEALIDAGKTPAEPTPLKPKS